MKLLTRHPARPTNRYHGLARQQLWHQNLSILVRPVHQPPNKIAYNFEYRARDDVKTSVTPDYRHRSGPPTSRPVRLGLSAPVGTTNVETIATQIVDAGRDDQRREVGDSPRRHPATINLCVLSHTSPYGFKLGIKIWTFPDFQVLGPWDNNHA